MRTMAMSRGVLLAAAGLMAGLAAPAHAAGQSSGQLGSIFKKAQQVHDLEISDEDRLRTGVSLGTAMGGAITQDEAHLSIHQRGRAHPFAIPRMM